MKVFKWLNTMMDRVFAVVGALILLQAPQFINQYTNRLAGHIDELKIHVLAIQRAAEKNGKDVAEYVQKFLQQADQDFVAQGTMMQTMINRNSDLSNNLLALKQATPFSRPYYFLKHMNVDVFKSTLSDFQPGLMLTIEGLIYAVLGIAVGVLFYHAVLFVIRGFLTIPQIAQKKLRKRLITE